MKHTPLTLLAIISLALVGCGSTEAEESAELEPLEAIEQAANEDATANIDGINLEVNIPISETSKDMAAAKARQDATDALEAIQQHGDNIEEDWERIIIRGKQGDTEFMSPVYLPEDIAEVDFDNFNPANVWDLRDHGLVHPDLEDAN